MPHKVILPKFGQTVEVSTINQWLVAEGAQIRKGTVLCEISTDKSALEVESMFEGTLLKILLPTGKQVPVGCVMALIGQPGEQIPEALIAECLATQVPVPSAAKDEPAATAPAPAPTATPAPAPVPQAAPVAKPLQATPVPAPAPVRSGRLLASPRARRIARTSQVPLQVLSGSGENGRIIERDVKTYLESIGPVTPAALTLAASRGIDLRGLTGSGPGGRILVADLAEGRSSTAQKMAPELPAVFATPAPLPQGITPLSPMRAAIARNMVLSSSTIPSFQVEMDVDAAAMIARREAEKAAGRRVSYTDIIARAVGLAARHHPALTAAWTDQGLNHPGRVNVGLAVALPDGLIVPVIHECDTTPLATVAERSAALVAKARERKLSQAECSGACITLSNLGALPVDRFVAIVPPGQAAIIAIGRIRDEVVVKDGGFFAARRMSLTISADHRIVDGATAAAFLADVKTVLEHAQAIG